MYMWVCYLLLFWVIVVVEARGKEKGVAKVVDRWGDPDSSKCVLAASIDDREFDPVCIIVTSIAAAIVLCVLWHALLNLYVLMLFYL